MEGIIAWRVLRFIEGITFDKVIQFVAKTTLESVINQIVQQLAESIPKFMKEKVSNGGDKFVEKFLRLEEVSKFLKLIQELNNKETDDLREEDIKEFDIKKQEACEAVKEESSKIKPPKYMDYVVFTCKKGVALNTEQKEALEAVLSEDYENNNSSSWESIHDFIEQYVGWPVQVGNVDGCIIGNTYISFNFFTEYGEEYLYDKEKLNSVVGAMNKLLDVNLFDGYLVDGHDESNLYE